MTSTSTKNHVLVFFKVFRAHLCKTFITIRVQNVFLHKPAVRRVQYTGVLWRECATAAPGVVTLALYDLWPLPEFAN